MGDSRLRSCQTLKLVRAVNSVHCGGAPWQLCRHRLCTAWCASQSTAHGCMGSRPCSHSGRRQRLGSRQHTASPAAPDHYLPEGAPRAAAAAHKGHQGGPQQCCHIGRLFTLLRRAAKIKHTQAPQVCCARGAGRWRAAVPAHRGPTRHAAQQIRVQLLSASCVPPSPIACTPAPGPACTSGGCNKGGL